MERNLNGRINKLPSLTQERFYGIQVIVDAHAHLGRSHDLTLNTKQLILIMDRSRVDRAVMVPMASGQKHNEHLLRELSRYSNRLVGSLWINPRTPALSMQADRPWRVSPSQGL